MGIEPAADYILVMEQLPNELFISNIFLKCKNRWWSWSTGILVS